MTISFCMAVQKEQEDKFKYLFTSYNGSGGYIRPMSKTASAINIKQSSPIFQVSRRTSIFKLNVWPK